MGRSPQLKHKVDDGQVADGDFPLFVFFLKVDESEEF